eukprot:TRINITY_DN32996_c0_g1_i1.p1 TRINITY_DN32996_c0_g1~~TRINITY_DN32996_c0_g1_i1.p1  ORF type:complete len:918 (+),score=123.33 TRINITY_DN32996_c0_g1_i1:56-2809(+)
MNLVCVQFLDGSTEMLRCERVDDLKHIIARVRGLPKRDDVHIVGSEGLPLEGDDTPPDSVTVVLQDSSFVVTVLEDGVRVAQVCVTSDINVKLLRSLIADTLSLESGTMPVLSYNGVALNRPKCPLSEYGILENSNIDMTLHRVPVADCVYRGCDARSAFLASSRSLRTIDQCQEADLLPRAASGKDCGSQVSTLCQGNVPRRAVETAACLPQLLSLEECVELLDRARALDVCPLDMADGAEGMRSYRRLLVRDDKLAGMLWERAEKSIRSALQGHDLRPVGFGCGSGEWELAGLNPGFRINQYSAGGFIRAHRDSQYSESVDFRSLCTLLVPLQSKGSIRFYKPRQRIDCKGMNLSEEINSHGGLDNGYASFDHVYLAGQGVLMGQLLLHEGLPDERHGPAKALLRTDVLVRRVTRPSCVLISEAERSDHVSALKLFREAQHAELRGEPADELYEHALSYRYAYPTQHPQPASNSASEAGGCSKASSSLFKAELQVKDGALPTASSPLLSCHRGFIMPKLVYHSGPVAAFLLSPSSGLSRLDQELPEEDQVHSDAATAAHLRAVAMYSLHLLGHPCDGDGRTLYTAKFDPRNYTVTALPLEELLRDAFLSRRCFGAVYNVWTGAGEEPKPADDLSHAVDRTYMMLAHGCDCFGDDIASRCGAVLKASTLAEESDSEDPSESEYLGTEEYIEVLQESGHSHQLMKYLNIRAAMDSKEPPLKSFLKHALDPGRRGLPCSHVFHEESMCIHQTGRCYGHYGDCGSYDYETEDAIHKHRSVNNLVFDFDKRWMGVLSWNASAPLDRPPDDALLAMDDPHSLWTELEEQIQAAGHSAESFERYSVGLQEVLKDAEHSFHHAGGCGCRRTRRTIDVRLTEFDEEDHATRVLVAVGAPDHVFGKPLLPGDILVWTIYHGFAAL